MRNFWLLLSALPLLAQAGPLSVISASGAPQAGGAESARVLRVGDQPAGDALLSTPAGASLQLRTEDGSTLSLGELSELKLDASKRTLSLSKGFVAVFSDQSTWDVSVAGNRLRSKGFLRLRVCGTECKERPAFTARSMVEKWLSNTRVAVRYCATSYS